MSKNSFYKTELRVLFSKYNVAPTDELIEDLAQLVGSKIRAAEGANKVVNEFAARFGSVENLEQIGLCHVHDLQSTVYGIVWQQSLEK